MSPARRLALVGLGLLLASGCAARPKRPTASAWRFPETYRATQVVTVSMPEGPLDFLASVTRAGRHLEVVLFDPALQVPLISASGGDGPATETIYLQGVPSGSGRRLVDLLDGLHVLDFKLEAGSRATASGGWWRFSLSDFQFRSSCRFPRLIEVEPLLEGPRISVETTDVACGPDLRVVPR